MGVSAGGDKRAVRPAAGSYGDASMTICLTSKLHTRAEVPLAC